MKKAGELGGGSVVDGNDICIWKSGKPDHASKVTNWIRMRISLIARSLADKLNLYYNILSLCGFHLLSVMCRIGKCWGSNVMWGNVNSECCQGQPVKIIESYSVWKIHELNLPPRWHQYHARVGPNNMHFSTKKFRDKTSVIPSVVTSHI